MHSHNCLFIIIFSIITIAVLNSVAFAGVVHSHETTNNNNNKERVEDGAYSPRDHNHYSDGDGGGVGEHHSEFDHEAILGSHKEAEEFDHLPPEEAKRRLGLLLKKMDLDGNEYIDKKELKSWILRSFKMLSEEEAKERFEDADEDDNGVITWSEYLSDTYGLDEKDTLPIGDDNDHLVEDDKVMWKAADINVDEVLDPVEWVPFSHPEEHPAMLPIILKQTLRDKDKDGDGALSFQEFIGDRGQNHDKDWVKIEKDKFDHDLDKDQDGLLRGNEILSWVVPSNEEIADEEVAHLFVASDDDHDDLISFNEAINHHDTFVGSEATDYGDHLHNIHHFNDEL